MKSYREILEKKSSPGTEIEKIISKLGGIDKIKKRYKSLRGMGNWIRNAAMDELDKATDKMKNDDDIEAAEDEFGDIFGALGSEPVQAYLKKMGYMTSK